MNYTHLSHQERYQIYALKQEKISNRRIAKILGRNPSTISREINRNKGKRGYEPKQANKMATTRRANNAYQINKQTWQWVIDKIKLKWRPEQIAGVHGGISHMSIYRYLYRNKQQGGLLYRHLKHQLKPYRKGKLHDGRGQLTDRKSIKQRPHVVDEKKRIGDWEIDTIIGKNHKQALVTIVDRVSGLVKIKKVTHKTADMVEQATIALLRPVKMFVKTITSDNGKEFANHKAISKQLHSLFYFADAYASWQRGANENVNGLIRQYLPKKTDFTDVPLAYIQFVEDALNNRPRKRLGYKTPIQVFYNIG